ncbi:hypothetical protein KC950_03985 [Candidatus Saccharibacteria bacterium]|nr:hypothetical protein [Candidatus Saccharibacteria bacterium]
MAEKVSSRGRAQTKSVLGKVVSITVLVFAVIFLFLAQSAYWINHTVFNQDSFTNITTTALQQESSRDAISQVIVNNALQDRPVLQRVVGERAQSLISGLLASDLSAQAINALTSKTYQYATSSDRQDISINLASIKDPLSNVLAISQNEQTTERISNLPDEITLLKRDEFPNLSGFVVAMLWLAPLLWLVTLLLFTVYVLLDRKEYAKKVYFAGVAIIGVGIFGYLTSPYVPSPIAASIPTIEIRPLAQNLLTGYLNPFRSQMVFMISFTGLTLIVFNQRFNIAKLFKSFDKKQTK